MVDGRTVGDISAASRSADEISRNYGYTYQCKYVNMEGRPNMATQKTAPLDGSLIARKGEAVPARVVEQARQEPIAVTVKLTPELYSAAEALWDAHQAPENEPGHDRRGDHRLSGCRGNRLMNQERLREGDVWSKYSNSPSQEVTPLPSPALRLVFRPSSPYSASRGTAKAEGERPWTGNTCWRISQDQSIRNCCCAMSIW